MGLFARQPRLDIEKSSTEQMPEEMGKKTNHLTHTYLRSRPHYKFIPERYFVQKQT